MDEKQLLNAIMEKTHEAIIVVDNNNIIAKCDKQILKFVGKPLNEVIGMPINVVMPGLDTDKEISNFELKPKANSFIVRAEEIIIENETFKIFFFSDNHFNIELGNRCAEMKILIDIYESILNSIDEGIHVADINGYVKYINPSQQSIDGLTADVIGKHWTEVYRLDEETSLVLKALHEAKITHDEYQTYVTREGKYVSIVCSTMPLYSEGKMIGAVAITKDFIKFKEMAEKILNTNAHTKHPKQKRKVEPWAENCKFNQILGENKLFQESIKWGQAGAKSNSAVLIYGETGTGKEMFAQSIHAESERANGPFVAINCAAIPESLLEGILFGTTKGAFTGAVDRAGLIEMADSGTLFLDEINSMPFQLQSKLLRFLEEKRITRLGSKDSISVDIRVVSSCNLEPSEAIERKQLRSDLFYRLAVIYIYLPPLRKRPDDLDILTRYFIDKYNREMGKQINSMEENVKEMFQGYSWPGNVRELMHCIECATSLIPANETQIKSEHLPKNLILGMQKEKVKPTSFHNTASQEPASPPPNLTEAGLEQNNHGNIIEQIRQQEKEEIIHALKMSNGNIARAAKSLGLSRQRLHYRLKKYHLV